MELEKILKQLHKIQPDPDYARNSRLRIIGLAHRAPKFTVRTFVMGILRSGSAMAVTGLMLLLALGGFSLYGLIGSVSGLDDSLRAEAQAISMQIHLADLQYRDGGYGRQSLIAGNDFSSPEIEELPAPAPAEEPPVVDEPDESQEPPGDEPVDGDEPADTDPNSTSTEDNVGTGTGDSPAATSTEDGVPAPEPVSVERALEILSR
jgi:hypothetical protein